jgi:5-methylcytosine-specific restriction protein B
LGELRGHPELAAAATKDLERLLYLRFSPFEGRVVKIAPGTDAEFWPECRAGGYVCVGWDEVGDLRQYESKEAYLAAFRAAFGDVHKTEAKLREKANEVWLLLDLAVGERVVANKGTKEVLAVGTIESPGYVWDTERESHNHTLRVSWDESFAKEIPAQPYWAFKTVYPLSSKVRALALGEEEPEDGEAAEPQPPVSPEEPWFLGGSRRRSNARTKRSCTARPGQERRGMRAGSPGGGLRDGTPPRPRVVPRLDP